METNAENDAHLCHWPTCRQPVPPRMWGCRDHWFMLPKRLRNRILATYVPGQEIAKTPTPAYLEAARQVQEWIAGRDAPRPIHPSEDPSMKRMR